MEACLGRAWTGWEMGQGDRRRKGGAWRADLAGLEKVAPSSVA